MATDSSTLNGIVFAHLTPANLEAKRAFAAVAEEVRNGHFQYHSQFIHIAEDKVRLNDDFPMSPSHQQSESEAVSDTDISTEDQVDVWSGYYMFGFGAKLQQPRAGWRIGCYNRKSKDTDSGVDLMLSTSRAHGLHTAHGRLTFAKTGVPILWSGSRTGSGIVLGSEAFQNSQRALLSRSARVQFGALAYIFSFTIDPKSKEETAFQKQKLNFLKALRPDQEDVILSVSATPTGNELSFGDWTIKGVVGHGAFGAVEAAVSKKGEILAMKSMKRQDKSTSRSISSEVDNATLLKPLLETHDLKGRILRLIEVIYERGNATFDGTHPERVWVLYDPLARGDFLNFLPKQEEDRKVLFIQVIEGLAFLHKHGWIHRDIKRGNLGIVSLKPLRAVILDLGQAIQMQEGALIPHVPGTVGTIPYLAPEMEQLPYGNGVDVWAVGVVAHELFIGNNPFDFPHNRWIRHPEAAILKIYDEATENIWKKSVPIGDLIIQMLQLHAPSRIPMNDALNHPSLSKVSLVEPEPPKTGSKRSATHMNDKA
ncbi:hypothetical protein MMC30_007833 [Trapelia coarctata]|nr:hypothetical protein [Trapelia coarctata]